jgi:hypothetical protein
MQILHSSTTARKTAVIQLISVFCFAISSGNGFGEESTYKVASLSTYASLLDHQPFHSSHILHNVNYACVGNGQRAYCQNNQECCSYYGTPICCNAGCAANNEGCE